MVQEKRLILPRQKQERIPCGEWRKVLLIKRQQKVIPNKVLPKAVVEYNNEPTLFPSETLSLNAKHSTKLNLQILNLQIIKKHGF